MVNNQIQYNYYINNSLTFVPVFSKKMPIDTLDRLEDRLEDCGKVALIPRPLDYVKMALKILKQQSSGLPTLTVVYSYTQVCGFIFIPTIEH